MSLNIVWTQMSVKMAYTQTYTGNDETEIKVRGDFNAHIEPFLLNFPSHNVFNTLLPPGYENGSLLANMCESLTLSARLQILSQKVRLWTWLDSTGPGQSSTTFFKGPSEKTQSETPEAHTIPNLGSDHRKFCTELRLWGNPLNSLKKQFFMTRDVTITIFE